MEFDRQSTVTIALGYTDKLDSFEVTNVVVTIDASDPSKAVGTIVPDWSTEEFVSYALRCDIHVASGEIVSHGIDTTSGASFFLVNSMNQGDTEEDARIALDRLLKKQHDLYDTPLGNPQADGSIEHRVLCVVERLYITEPLRLPGARLVPTGLRDRGNDERELLNLLTGQLGWPSHAEEEWWTQTASRNRPWMGILFPSVWASERQAAAELAWQERQRILDIICLERGAAGRPIATVVEQRRGAEVGPWRVYNEDTQYGGNLAAGFGAGEDQHTLVIHDVAMQRDPQLALCVGLYREALQISDEDGQYFRYWSVLETLSIARVSPGTPVTLLDGSQWPHGGNTGQAAPRVYELLAARVRAGVEQEQYLAQPAETVYEAVRIWYGRRSATAHYGKFVAGDATQSSQVWYPWAAMSLNAAEFPFTHLRALKETARIMLMRELMDVGRTGVLDG